jgi:hypothetical protein
MTTRSKPKTASPKKKKPLADKRPPSAPEPDAKLRAKYAALRDEMATALRGEMRGWDRYWEAVATIIAERWYMFDGYRNAAEWIGAEMDVPLRTALRNTRVATVASPDEEAKYTPTKIDLALSLLDAKSAAKAARDGAKPDAAREANVDLAALRFDVERDGKKRKLALDEVTTDELRALLRRSTRKDGVTKARLRPTAQALADALAAHETLSDLALSERDGLIVLGGFRADQIAELGRVLLAVRVSAADKRQ